MLAVWRNQLKGRTPIEQYGGKCFKDCIFRGFGSLLVLILVWGSVICGQVVSVPLGFEVEGNLVSENGVFAFGVYDNLDELAVGIWYNLGNKTANVLVWKACRFVAVPGNYSIKLSMDGSLTLFNNINGVSMWSSNTANLGARSASLLDNGNLVLKGIGDRVIWESFSTPTNALLPGQSLRYPHLLQAPSKIFDSGLYSLVIRLSGELALVWDNHTTYWSSHLTSTAVAKEARFESSGLFGLYDASGGTVWVKSSEDFIEQSVVLRHLRIDTDGNLRIYSWDNVLLSWRVGWQAIENQCTVFGSCGLYSVCGYNTSGHTCGCLSQDSIDWDGRSSGKNSTGCMPIVDVKNCNTGMGISTLIGTVLYDIYPPHDVQLMLNQEACKNYCLHNSSCVAATSMNDGSGLCTVKTTNFIGGYQDASGSAVSFTKYCLVPQAAQTNLNDNLVRGRLPSGQRVSQRTQRTNWKKFIAAVAIIVAVSVCVFLGIEILVLWFIHRRRQRKAQSRIPFGKDGQMNPYYSTLIRLSSEEVKELTGNFKDQLGPSVFKGVLPNRTPVAAKMLKSVVASEKDFRMIVTTLGSTHHRNLVQLKGFCLESTYKIIIYEHIPSGSLDKWLFKSKRDRNGRNWQQKLDIARGVARALAYLHSECQMCIAHGNLKLENVLLDENLVAKVTDFGLRSLLEKESDSSSESLPERDIYMFGQMLLQLLMGQHDIVGCSPQRFIHDMYHDKKSVGTMEWEGIERACRIALWCMQDQPFLRPSIGEVVKVLEGNLSVDQPPPSVAFERENQVDDEESAGTDIKVVS